jgi:ring-1,2-phenylacetyl-CoA epoxidase subunit PaaE
MLLDGLRGRHPAPLVQRRGGHEVLRPRASERAARILRVVEVERQTADAISFALEDPAGAPIAFQPGQFFTLLCDLDGRSHRRAYSAASSHRDTARVRLAVKRVHGGRVSGYLVEHLRAGQLVRVLGPSGSFTCTPDPGAARHIVLLAGGSGITPMMAIAEAVLAGEPRSAVSLIYGNRRAEDIIFRARIDELARAFPERLRVRHVLEQPPPQWTGGAGMLAADVLARELDALDQLDARDRIGQRVTPARIYYLCGPEPMLVAARQTLHARGVPGHDVFEERFSQPHLRRDAPAARSSAVETVHVHVGRADEIHQVHRIRVQPGETILDAALAARVPLPFSCAMGGCGACKVKRRSGTVTMDEPSCLTPAEREAGYVLTCVGRPVGPVAIEVEAP